MDLWWVYDGICDMSGNRTGLDWSVLFCAVHPQNPLKSRKAYPSGHWLWAVESDATTPGRCPLWRVRGSARCYRTWWCKRPGCAARRRAHGGTSPERSPLRRPNPGPSHDFWCKNGEYPEKMGEIDLQMVDKPWCFSTSLINENGLLMRGVARALYRSSRKLLLGKPPLIDRHLDKLLITTEMRIIG